MKWCRLAKMLCAALLFSVTGASGQSTTADLYKAGHEAMVKADFDGAIAAYTQAMGLEPKSFRPFEARGFAKLYKYDLDGALADFSQAISLEPSAFNAYYGRAVVEQAQGKLDAAISDYHDTLKLTPPAFVKTNSTRPDKTHFYLWLARVQQNQQADANKELSDYMSKRPTSANWWYTRIGNFLLGQYAEVDVLTSAVSVRSAEGRDYDQCEAWYFVGMKRLLAGDKSAAADYFRKCAGTNQVKVTEFVLARAESEALQLNP